MICGRRADRRIRHHLPVYPVVAAAMAMVEEAAGVIINSTLEGERQAGQPVASRC
jgi:hypothetical protein